MLPLLSRLSVSHVPGCRLRHRCSAGYQRISPLHPAFRIPLPCSSRTVSNALPGLSPGLSHPTHPAAYAPFTPSKSEQRSPPLYYRGCWHRVSRGFLLVLSDQLTVVALVGRYPANKLMVYGPIPSQEVLRSPPLAKRGCPRPPHSVLAPLSGRYPQRQGRLPILSSPFRHSHQTNPIAIHGSDPVRLACLIHAASVRSEPESNSQTKTKA